MVMQAPWLPEVTEWTSLTMDSMGVLQHPNAMYSHGHRHAHCTSQQQGGMFQLADADRCCAVFVRLGQKVECIAPCQLAPVLLSKKKKKTHLSEDRSNQRPSEPRIGITPRCV